MNKNFKITQQIYWSSHKQHKYSFLAITSEAYKIVNTGINFPKQHYFLKAPTETGY